MGIEPTNLLHAMQALYQLSYAPEAGIRAYQSSRRLPTRVPEEASDGPAISPPSSPSGRGAGHSIDAGTETHNGASGGRELCNTKWRAWGSEIGAGGPR